LKNSGSGRVARAFRCRVRVRPSRRRPLAGSSGQGLLIFFCARTHPPGGGRRHLRMHAAARHRPGQFLPGLVGLSERETRLGPFASHRRRRFASLNPPARTASLTPFCFLVVQPTDVALPASTRLLPDTRRGGARRRTGLDRHVTSTGRWRVFHGSSNCNRQRVTLFDGGMETGTQFSGCRLSNSGTGRTFVSVSASRQRRVFRKIPLLPRLIQTRADGMLVA
jgi:hypothetical protein